jgi:hypothetical protein
MSLKDRKKLPERVKHYRKWQAAQKAIEEAARRKGK